VVDRSFAVGSQIEENSQRLTSLFLKYKTIDNPIISGLISSIPGTFSDTVKMVLSSNFYSSDFNTRAQVNRNAPADFIVKNRTTLAKFINKFHLEADTMTSKVRHSIKLLNDPNTKLLVSAHQPNLFAYGGVFKKIVLLHTLQNVLKQYNSEIKIVNLFLIADHDFMEELWTRYAQLPNVQQSSGILELRMPVNNSHKQQMMCNISIPERSILDNWKKQILSWIDANCSSSLLCSSERKSHLLENFGQFWQQLEISYSKAKGYSDFNSFLMSQIVNEVWNYDTLFVRLTDISLVFEDGLRYLINNFDKYSKALTEAEKIFSNYGINNGISSASYQKAPVWLHCKCGSKASAKIITQDNRQQEEEQQIILAGTCLSCKRHLLLNLGNKNTLDFLNREEVLRQLSPVAIPIILLLSRDLGITCYASGTAGIRYIIHGSIMFKELSINLPQIIIWPARDIYYGIGQSKALEAVQLTKQSDVKPYLQSLNQKIIEYDNKISSLVEERMRRINFGEPLHTLLSDLYYMKQKQKTNRQLVTLLERAKNAIEVNPCFVDYAVNFGIDRVEEKWRQNLLTNNNFAAPILMDNNNTTSHISLA
jgi:hypothetical protein